MGSALELEDIRHMRRREGIHDADLRRDIRGLRASDRVQLTFKTAPEDFHGETLLVRITRVRGKDFLGKLAQRPQSVALAQLKVGARITFTAAHIHSLPRGGPAIERPGL